MPATNSFPTETQLQQPERRWQLLQEFYERHHARNRNYAHAKHREVKANFFTSTLAKYGLRIARGIDLGCRAGTFTQALSATGQWVGVDIDAVALEHAREQGIACVQSDISIALDFQSDRFDGVLLTEVLEHLPYPAITIHEVYRILKKAPGSVFLGSVPLDYNLSRRFSVLFGQRVTKDPTHLHSFSFQELRDLLAHYFEDVQFLPLRGAATWLPWLPWTQFVKDIAWVARSPRPQVTAMEIYG